jgi:hypothetical protein
MRGLKKAMSIVKSDLGKMLSRWVAQENEGYDKLSGLA